jgi:hypothetical protein
MFLTSVSTRGSPFFANSRILSSLTPSQPVYEKLSAMGGHAVRLGTTGSYAHCPFGLDRDLLEYRRVMKGTRVGM